MKVLRRSLFMLVLCCIQHVTANSGPSQEVPALRVTAPNGKTSIMIGSLHSANAALRQPAASVMDGAKRFIVEGINDKNSSPQAWLDLASEVESNIAQRADWASVLTGEQERVFAQRIWCAYGGLLSEEGAREKANELLRRSSAAMAAGFAIYHCAPPGLKSRDQLLKNMAHLRGLTPLVLETQDEARQQRALISEETHRHNLVTAFTEASVRANQKVVDALNNGKYDKILDALNELSLNPAEARKYQQVMVTNRNLAWMPPLEKFLSEGNAFVNVGAAHLPGPQGLIALLRARGHKVTPILLPASQ